MPISYDKKGLKKAKKYLKMGKKKYAMRYSLYLSIILAFILSFPMVTIHEKFELRKYAVSFFILFAIYFIYGYYKNLKNWEGMKNLYIESIEYFKKNDPEFIKDILEENLNNDK